MTNANKVPAFFYAASNYDRPLSATVAAANMPTEVAASEQTNHEVNPLYVLAEEPTGSPAKLGRTVMHDVFNG